MRSRRRQVVPDHPEPFGRRIGRDRARGEVRRPAQARGRGDYVDLVQLHEDAAVGVDLVERLHRQVAPRRREHARLPRTRRQVHQVHPQPQPLLGRALEQVGPGDDRRTAPLPGRVLGHDAVVERVRGVVHQAGGAIGHRVGDEDARRHVGELLLDRAELGDRLSELLPVAGVLDGAVEALARGSDGAAAELEPSDVQDVDRDLVTAPRLAEEVLRRHLCVLQDELARRRALDAELLLLGPGRNAGIATLDQERGELLAVDHNGPVP